MNVLHLYRESNIFNTNGAGIFEWMQAALTNMAHDKILLLYNNKKGGQLILMFYMQISKDG